MKICTKCKITKPFYFFNIMSSSKDGFTWYCKSCISELKIKKWAETKPPTKVLCNVEKNCINCSNIFFDKSRTKTAKFCSKKCRISTFAKSNPGKVNARNSKYIYTKRKATPSWLTKEQLRDIEEFYILAQELAWLNQDGKPFHVDHIIPLQGRDICGLHVPWNLQLLPENVNCSKGNKYE